MQAYVIPGTIADTVLHQMDNALKVRLGIKKRCGEELVISILQSAKGKSAISEFWKNSASISSTSIGYERSKVTYIIVLVRD